MFDFLKRAPENQPPGPRGIPFFGSMIEYEKDPIGFLTRCTRVYGDVFLVNMLSFPTVFVANPRDFERITRTENKSFIKDRFSRNFSVLGKGLFLSSGELWRRQRRLAAPPLAHQSIKRYADLMVSRAEALAERMSQKTTCDVNRDTMRFALEVAAEALFGVETGSEVETVDRAVHTIMEYFMSPFSQIPGFRALPIPMNRRYLDAIRELDAIIYGFIRQRELNAGDKHDLLSTLLSARDEDGSRLDETQLRDELIGFYLAGHETTSLALAYGLYLLAGAPDVEAKLLAEVSALGDHALCAADFGSMPYTQAVFKETLRMYTPIWLLGREAIHDVELGGYMIKKGSQVMLLPYLVHHDARVFDDPESFQPTRWLDGRAERLPRGAYLPFGDGPRVCIGQHFAMMEGVLTLGTLVRRLCFRRAPGKSLGFKPSLSLRPRDGIWLEVRRRSPEHAHG